MSNCTIKIRIGNQEILLDPNANISREDYLTIANSIDTAKARKLYNNIKDLSTFSTPSSTEESIRNGESVYKYLVDKAKEEGEFVTPLNALITFPRKLESILNGLKGIPVEDLTPTESTIMLSENPISDLRSYVQSLNMNSILESGNFLTDMSQAYKQSPQTVDHIHNVFFKKSSIDRQLFTHLTSIPGMETLKIAVAVEGNATKVKGVYISPDNIIQIIIPDTKGYVSVSKTGDISNFALKDKAVKESSRIILHELAHAVFTELYKADPKFRTEVKGIYDKFIKSIGEQNITENAKKTLKSRYKDIQEFVADVFTDTGILRVLSNTPVESEEEVNKNLTLYDYFVRLLNDKAKVEETLLSEVIKSYSTDSMTSEINDMPNTTSQDMLENDEFRFRFFSGEEFTEEEVDAHISPRDIYDSFGSTNSKAFYIQKWFTDNIKEGVFTKDIYFKAATTPNNYKLDNLIARDIVNIPWLKYVKGDDKKKGYWQEQGVLVDTNKKPVLTNGKITVVNLNRDEKGNIIQDNPKGKIEERLNSAPVVYSNSNNNTVVVAKVSDSLTKDTINTVSIPYNLVRSIRKYDRSYFDHTEDYDTQIETQNNRLSELIKGDPNYEESAAADIIRKNITELETKREKAEAIIQRNRDLHRKYSFSVKDESDPNIRLLNVSESDYAASGYKFDADGSKLFAKPEDAVYRIFKGKNGKYYTTPNPSKFIIMYEQGNSFLQSFANSSDYASSLTDGDLVQFDTKIDVGDGNTIEVWQWAPITRSIANGVEVATPNGKGLIVPYNKVKAFAKNLESPWFMEKVGAELREQTEQIKSMIYAKPNTPERVLKSELLKYKSFQFNEQYHKKAEESNEDALQRFEDNRSRLIENAVPYKTYIQVKRKFQSWDEVLKKRVSTEYDSIEIVMGKSSRGFLTAKYNLSGSVDIGVVPFDATENSEITFMINSLKDVSDVWNEFVEEKATLQSNYEKYANGYNDVKSEYMVNEGTPESPKMKFTFDRRLNPTRFSDRYDFYDDVSKYIGKLTKGDVVGLAFKTTEDADADSSKTKTYFRKIVEVKPDGTVVVAENRKSDVELKNGFIMKAGLYAKSLNPEDIKMVGLKAYDITSTADSDIIELRKELHARREYMLETAKRDLDYNDFIFRARSTALKFNAAVDKRRTEGKAYKYFIPFTADLIDKNATGFLDKKLNPVAEDVTWVQAWVKNGTVNPIRGVNANSTFYKKKDIISKDGKTLLPNFLSEIRTGDWVVTEYRDSNGKKKHFNKLIERITDNEIYTLNADLSTYKVNFSNENVIGIRTSVRNDKWSNFKRTDKLNEILGFRNMSKQSKNSLDTPYKSARDSYRAINEITDRFKELNPEISVKFVESKDITQLIKSTGFNYANSRAFILNGEVNINTDRASVSDVIHEYTHLFLHSLKYDDYNLYKALINAGKTSEISDKVIQTYSHLEGDDLNEEVFVTVLGEFLKGRLSNQEWEDSRRADFSNFAQYTKEKLGALLNKEVSDIRDISADDVFYMKLEDIIMLIGDWTMNNRLTDIYEDHPLNNSSNIEKLKQDLIDRGFLTQHCYG